MMYSFKIVFCVLLDVMMLLFVFVKFWDDLLSVFLIVEVEEFC